MRPSVYLLCGAVCIQLLGGCQAGIPEAALQLDSETLQKRQLQKRRFETQNERTLLQASNGVLQDLGFSLEESETELGVIVGSKDRTAREGGQIAAQIVMAALFQTYMPTDRNQTIRVSLVTLPTTAGSTNVRVTFQRLVWNDANQLTTAEFLGDPAMYQDFFDRLSQSVFLDAHLV